MTTASFIACVLASLLPPPPFSVHLPSPMLSRLIHYPSWGVAQKPGRCSICYLPPLSERAPPRPGSVGGIGATHLLFLNTHSKKKKSCLVPLSLDWFVRPFVRSGFVCFSCHRYGARNVGRSRKWTLEWWSLKPEERRLIHVYLIKRTHEKSWLRNITAEEIEGCFCR